jgi:signal transduction histidine kinase
VGDDTHSQSGGSDLTIEGLVHDLNNVFETFIEAADVLGRDPKHVRLSAALKRSVNRGSRILSSFLEQTQASLELELILDNAIEFARDSLQAVRGPSIDFVKNFEPGIRLRGNAAAWERVLANLFLNAAQAIAQSGDLVEKGAIEISAARTPAAIEITVADNGPGIHPKILPRIFEPHFSTRARRSGLGLHIVQTIVRQNGGEVSASNRPSGQGAQFHIILPSAT